MSFISAGEEQEDEQEEVQCKNTVQVDFNAIILFCIMISIIGLNYYYPKFCSPDL